MLKNSSNYLKTFAWEDILSIFENITALWNYTTECELIAIVVLEILFGRFLKPIAFAIYNIYYTQGCFT